MFLLIQDDGVNAYKVRNYCGWLNLFFRLLSMDLSSSQRCSLCWEPHMKSPFFWCQQSLLKFSTASFPLSPFSKWIIPTLRHSTTWYPTLDFMYLIGFQFLAVFQDANEAMAFARLSLIFFFALTLWKIGVYNRCADYLHARHKERNAVRSQTHATTTKTYASQTPTPLYPVVI